MLFLFEGVEWAIQTYWRRDKVNRRSLEAQAFHQKINVQPNQRYPYHNLIITELNWKLPSNASEIHSNRNSETYHTSRIFWKRIGHTGVQSLLLQRTSVAKSLSPDFLKPDLAQPCRRRGKDAFSEEARKEKKEVDGSVFGCFLSCLQEWDPFGVETRWIILRAGWNGGEEPPLHQIPSTHEERSSAWCYWLQRFPLKIVGWL